MRKRSKTAARLAICGAAALAIGGFAGCFSNRSNPNADVLDAAAWAGKVRAQMVPGALNIATMSTGGLIEEMFLAAEQVNQAGGVAGGRPVNLIVLSDDDFPAGKQDATFDGIAAAGVKILAGSMGSGEVLGFLPRATPEDMIIISSSALSPSVTTADDPMDLLFRTAPSNAIQADLLGRVVYDDITATATVSGRTPTASIIFQSGDSFSEAVRTSFHAAFERVGGRIVQEVSFDETGGLTEDTINAAVAQAFAATQTADRVVLAAQADPDPSASILISWARQFPPAAGARSPWIFIPTQIDPGFISNLPGNVQAGINGTQGLALAAGLGDRFARFAADYQARFGVRPDSFRSTGYDAIVLIALAAERAFVLDHVTDPTGSEIACHIRAVANPPGDPVGPGVASIAAGLEKIRQGVDIDYQGAYAAFNLDANGDIDGEAAYTVVRFDQSIGDFASGETVVINFTGPQVTTATACFGSPRVP